MKIIDIPTEQTTAATDGIIAIISFMAAMYLQAVSNKKKWKATLWKYFFYLLTIASILGAIAHGLRMSQFLQDLIWHPLYFTLGLLIGIFMVAVLNDLFGERTARRAIPIMVCISFVFFLITAIWSDSFLLFIVYQAVIMLFALGTYIWLSYRSKLDGGWYMACGVFVTIVAAIFQTFNSISITFVWPFDHNGIYHLIQIVGILLLVAGLSEALDSHD